MGPILVNGAHPLHLTQGVWIAQRAAFAPTDAQRQAVLSDRAIEVRHPRFSPDGKWVVFTSNRAGFNDEWSLTWFPQPYGELVGVPVAGGPTVRLTHDKWEDGPSDWGYVHLAGRQ